MEELICQAISAGKAIAFYRDGRETIVDPFTLGIHKSTGNLSLSAWWVGGYSKSISYPYWRFYTVSELSSIRVLERNASTYQIHYNPSDKRMSEIFCTA